MGAHHLIYIDRSLAASDIAATKNFAEFAAKLVELYGAENAEQIADLELILGFLIFLPGVALATLAFIYLRQMRSRK